MGRAHRLRVYRSAFIFSAVLWVCSAVFFIIGLSMVAEPGPGPHGGQVAVVLGVVVGTFCTLVAALIGCVTATNRLVVTAAGLTLTYELRRRFVGWSDIRSFGVGPSRLVMSWPCLVIFLDSGSVTVSSVTGLTKWYAARIASELTVLQRELTTGPSPGADRPEVEPP